jgi:hypothetical protein
MPAVAVLYLFPALETTTSALYRSTVFHDPLDIAWDRPQFCALLDLSSMLPIFLQAKRTQPVTERVCFQKEEVITPKPDVLEICHAPA